VVQNFTLLVMIPGRPYWKASVDVILEDGCDRLVETDKSECMPCDRLVYRTERVECRPFADVLVFNLRSDDEATFELPRFALLNGYRPLRHQRQVDFVALVDCVVRSFSSISSLDVDWVVVRSNRTFET
jgi:hypothetical protein